MKYSYSELRSKSRSTFPKLSLQQSKKTKKIIGITIILLLILFSLIQNERAKDVYGHYGPFMGTTTSITVTPQNSSRSWFSNTVTIQGYEFKYVNIIIRKQSIKFLIHDQSVWVK